MAGNEIEKRLGGLLEKLNFIGMTIRNLKENHSSFLLDIDGIDERIFQELAEFEILTEDLKRTFVELLIRDANRISSEAKGRYDLQDRATGMLANIRRMMEEMRKHENKDISKSEELKEVISSALDNLGEIRSDTEGWIKEASREKKVQDRNRVKRAF